jgi:hypothetical protein
VVLLKLTEVSEVRTASIIRVVNKPNAKNRVEILGWNNGEGSDNINVFNYGGGGAHKFMRYLRQLQYHDV